MNELKNNIIPNVPHLRFTEFSGEWEKYRCSDFLTSFPTNSLSWEMLSYDEHTQIYNLHYGLIHNGAPTLIDTKKYKLPCINSSNIKNQTQIYNGDVIFADASEDTIEIGKCIEFINTNNQVIYSGLHTIHTRDTKDLTILGFKAFLFQSNYFHKQVERITQGTKIYSLNFTNFKELYVNIPNKKEQQKIATFLTLIDKRIETQMKIIEEYKSLIKGIREKILSKNNLLEEITIKEAVNKKLIRIIKPNELSHFQGQKKYLSTTSINEDGIVKIESYITYDNRPSRASMKPIKESVWFAKMKNSIKVFRSSGNDESKYVLSTGFYGVLSLSAKIKSLWLEQIFKSDYFNNQKDKFSEGSSMPGVKDNQFSDLKIKIFKDNNSQQKYIKILNMIEDCIKNNTIALSLLYKEKQYLLNNLFI